MYVRGGWLCNSRNRCLLIYTYACTHSISKAFDPGKTAVAVVPEGTPLSAILQATGQPALPTDGLVVLTHRWLDAFVVAALGATAAPPGGGKKKKKKGAAAPAAVAGPIKLPSFQA